MSYEIFREGGPLKTRRTGHDRYEMSVSLPKDADGRTARECPDEDCSPGYFKVTGGTGLKDQTVAYCPYCQKAAEPSDFHTKEQIRYAKALVEREAMVGIQSALGQALGLGNSGKRRLVRGLINAGLEMKPSRPWHVWQPYEDVLRRDIVCPHCTLDHSVYGFATWCPDCGKDISIAHVRAEIAVVEAILSDVDRRRQLLGPRVAASDLENALEDLVSIFEATLKIEIRRYRKLKGDGDATVDTIMRAIGSRLQSVTNAVTLISQHCDGAALFGSNCDDDARLNRVFQKRHPITHNLGVVDRRYIDRVRCGETEGTEVRVEKAEIEQIARLTYAVLSDLHNRLFCPVGT